MIADFCWPSQASPQAARGETLTAELPVRAVERWPALKRLSHCSMLNVHGRLPLQGVGAGTCPVVCADSKTAA